jgi:DNA-binding transcriptional LysR family regulator
MEIRHLRHFLAVSNTLNYSRAAEELHISPSPLSRSIQQLERDLGGALFVRGTRKVELTQLGFSLIPYANRIVDGVEEMEREAARRVRGHIELNIGMRSVPAELTTALVDDVIRTVEPSADVRLTPLDSFAQMDQIVAGRLSLGLVNRRSEDRRLDYLPVLTEMAGMALPDEPQFSNLDFVTPDDVVGLQLLTQPGADPRAPQLAEFRNAFRAIVPVDSNIIGGISTLIAQGGSCCFTIANPTAPWHKYLDADGVIIRPLDAQYARATTYLCWSADRCNPDDLGPIITRARERFEVPLEL